MKKRILALLLVLCMLFSTTPMALATDATDPGDGTSTSETQPSAAPEDSGDDDADALPAESTEPDAEDPADSVDPDASAEPAESTDPEASADPDASAEPAESADPSASADPEPEETIFHADIDFEEMDVVEVDMEKVQADLDAIVALKDDAANVDKISDMLFGKEGFANKWLTLLQTNYTLSSLKSAQNIHDSEATQAMKDTNKAYMDVYDNYFMAMKEIIDSACGKAITDMFPLEEDQEYIRSYVPRTDEEKEEANRGVELQEKYNQLYADDTGFFYVPITINGVETTFDAIYEAYQANKVSRDVALEAQLAAYQEWSKEMFDIYIQVIELEKSYLEGTDFETTADYDYKVTFGRDYTPEEIIPFKEAVKEYFPELLLSFENLLYISPNPYEYDDFTGDIAFDMIEEYVKSFSPEMAESFTYMREHHLYDYDNSNTKNGQGYTTILPSYGAPYTFNTPTGTFYDFTTAVHEFGHYNRTYWTAYDFWGADDSYDLSEVHSQGFELLFTQFYDEIFGEDAEIVTMEALYNLVSAIVSGCMTDDFEQYVFSEPDLTVEKLEAKQRELAIAYGLVSEDDSYTADCYACWWCRIPHIFYYPFYYISYATSAAGAFNFWLDAQENGWEDATAAYNKLVLMPPEADEEGYSVGFRKFLEAVGMEDPTTPEYVKELAEGIAAIADPQGKYEEIAGGDIEELEKIFSDVDRNTPHADDIWAAYQLGITNGTGNGTFDGDASFTRAQAAAVIYNCFGDDVPTENVFTDVPANAWYAESVNWAAANEIIVGTGDNKFSPDKVITCEEFMAYLYNMWVAMELDSADPDAELPYADADSISDWAYEAMVWADSLGLVEANESGNVEPQAEMNRLDSILTVYNLVLILFTA